jgi:hypothetical protein
MHHNRTCVVQPAPTERSRHRRRDTAAHATVCDIEHQGYKGDDQRHSSQRFRTQPTDENTIGDCDEDLHQHKRRRRAGQQKKAPANRRG